MPVLICADFNKTPDEMAQITWGPGQYGAIMLPNNTNITCMSGDKGSLIDYGYAMGNMQHLIKNVQHGMSHGRPMWG